MGVDLRSALESAEQSFSHVTTGAMRARLDARLRAGLARPRTTFGLPLLTSLVLAVAVGVLGTLAAQRLLDGPAERGGFEVASRSRARLEDDVVIARDVELRDPVLRARVTVFGEVKLRREPRGLRVLSGSARFEVDKEPRRAEPMRVLVSGGEIEVLGTTFSVVQTSGPRGSVALEEGAIRFRATDGETHELASGEALSWPVVRVAASVPPAPGVDDDPVPLPHVRRPALQSKADERPGDWSAVDRMVADWTRADWMAADWSTVDRDLRGERVKRRLTDLRSRGEWSEVLFVLESTLAFADDYPPQLCEQLSFELGSILSWQRGASAACEHWRAHLTRYPRGPHAGDARRSLEALRCP